MKTVLLILDGLGLSDDPTGNAVTPASMPYLFGLMRRHGFARLQASGEAVGLRKGVVGNSEIGHLTIGAGRTSISTLCRTDAAYADGSWSRHPLWQPIAAGNRLHIVGLLSDAGVHAHMDTIWRCAELAIGAGAREVVVHPLLDGVDSAAGSADRLFTELENKLARQPQIRLGMVMGRKWFCDRGGSPVPTRFFTDSLIGLEGLPAFRRQSLKSISHEHDFAPHGHPGIAGIGPGERILLTSHRADRALHAARMLAERHQVYSLIPLGDAVAEAKAFFSPERIARGIATEVTAAGLATSRIAESCKFPHVTSFFDGLSEGIGSRQFSIPTVDEDDLPRRPEMAARQVAATAIAEIKSGASDLVVVNIANLDQIGHLGRLDLAMAAAGHVDAAARQVSETAARLGWTTILLSDHGNADQVETADGRPFGSHTDRPVPLTIVPAPALRHCWHSKSGTLANIGATVLASLGLVPPPTMEAPLLSFAQADARGYDKRAVPPAANATSPEHLTARSE